MKSPTSSDGKFIALFVLGLIVAQTGSAQIPAPVVPPAIQTPGPSQQLLARLDPVLQQRASHLAGRSRIIARAVNAASTASLALLVRQLGGTLGRPLPIIDAQAAELPDATLLTLAASPLVGRLSLDRLIVGALERTRATVRAAEVVRDLRYDGSGIGVAVIDSGITSWHDDLTDGASGGGQRVREFVDFVNGRVTDYDDYGHGTHVAGLIAGNGSSSNGSYAGMAPGAKIFSLKVLDSTGAGYTSAVIQAIDFAVANKSKLGIDKLADDKVARCAGGAVMPTGILIILGLIDVPAAGRKDSRKN